MHKVIHSNVYLLNLFHLTLMQNYSRFNFAFRRIRLKKDIVIPSPFKILKILFFFNILGLFFFVHEKLFTMAFRNESIESCMLLSFILASFSAIFL
jgi:hypothetical protein